MQTIKIKSGTEPEQVKLVRLRFETGWLECLCINEIFSYRGQTMVSLPLYECVRCGSQYTLKEHTPKKV